MKEKNEGSASSPDAETLAQTCQYLEAMTLQAQTDVRSMFAKIVEAVHSREKQLLRQIDVAHSQQLGLVQSKPESAVSERVPHVSVQLDQEKTILELISNVGTVGLTGGSLVVLDGDGSFLQRVEDYQDANQDHMSMFKPVPMGSSMSPVNETVIRFTHITLPQNSPGPSENSSEVDESTSEFVTPQHQHMNGSTGTVESNDLKIENKTHKKKHPTQVQQWLKQLSAETETEPSIGEPKNFDSL
ncbi:uncharacterized protein LOC117644161 [Thrips palmi]|uniref:Uncharacterized protein LOC117644161 n=1 Tax=Thrips palmi TaxID=161013 RepID=A0A6P8YYH9_THRPL|nr:uncharacterized protein LOC117644161 [Thrips palmi]